MLHFVKQTALVDLCLGFRNFFLQDISYLEGFYIWFYGQFNPDTTDLIVWKLYSLPEIVLSQNVIVLWAHLTTGSERKHINENLACKRWPKMVHGNLMGHCWALKGRYLECKMLHMFIFNIHKIPVFCDKASMTKYLILCGVSPRRCYRLEGEGSAKIVWETPLSLFHLFACPLS